jgi:hypothetical protein
METCKSLDDFLPTIELDCIETTLKLFDRPFLPFKAPILDLHRLANRTITKLERSRVVFSLFFPNATAPVTKNHDCFLTTSSVPVDVHGILCTNDCDKGLTQPSSLTVATSTCTVAVVRSLSRGFLLVFLSLLVLIHHDTQRMETNVKVDKFHY